MLEITNWKLKELGDHCRVIHSDSMKYITEIINKQNWPVDYNKHFHRGESNIHWEKMSEHYSFFFDYVGNEEVGDYLLNSQLKNYEEIIITYGHLEPVVSIDMEVFLKDWEEIFASTLYNSILHTHDYKLILEITRDYYAHSNFKIE